MKALERRLGLGAIVAISISSMLGSGVFVLPSIAIQETGSSAWLAYLLSAICVLPAAISKSELATAMPTSGGTYVYLERTFGPLVGTVAGLGLFLSLLLKAAFALVGFGAYLSIITNFPLISTALVSLALILVLNILGIGKVSGVLKITVSISVIFLLFLAAYGSLDVRTENFETFFLNGHSGLLAAMSLVFVSFAGVTKVAAIAEEIKNPEKNLPYGILISLFVVTVIYCSITYVISGHLSTSNIVGDLKPIHTLVDHIFGSTIGIVAAIIAILTMASMANAGILAASRFPFAMARDHLLPSAFGKINSRFLTPVVSIAMCGVIVALVLILLNVQIIVKLASAFILMIYVAENVAVIILREVRVQWYKPRFRSFFYPWLQGVWEL